VRTYEVWLAKKNLLTGRLKGREGEKKRRTSSLFFFVCFIITTRKKKKRRMRVWNERIFAAAVPERARARAQRETDVM